MFALTMERVIYGSVCGVQTLCTKAQVQPCTPTIITIWLKMNFKTIILNWLISLMF